MDMDMDIDIGTWTWTLAHGHGWLVRIVCPGHYIQSIHPSTHPSIHPSCFTQTHLPGALCLVGADMSIYTCIHSSSCSPSQRRVTARQRLGTHLTQPALLASGLQLAGSPSPLLHSKPNPSSTTAFDGWMG